MSLYCKKRYWWTERSFAREVYSFLKFRNFESFCSSESFKSSRSRYYFNKKSRNCYFKMIQLIVTIECPNNLSDDWTVQNIPSLKRKGTILFQIQLNFLDRATADELLAISPVQTYTVNLLPGQPNSKIN